METFQTNKLSQVEASYLAGDISESEYLFQIDPSSPQGREYAGGLRRSWAILLMVFSGLGAFASIALLYEEYIHSRYPLAALGCTLNSKLSCADAFDAWQGHLLFGIPNAVPGLLAFICLLGISGYLLIGGTLPYKLWRLLLGGLGAGMILVFWFLYTSLMVFQALCPFCLMVWAAVISLFWLVLAVVLRQKLSFDNPSKSAIKLVIRFWFLIALMELVFLAAIIFSRLGLAVLGL